MAILPVAGFIKDAARTTAEQKAALDDEFLQRVREMFGGQAEETLDIASGSVTPTGAVCLIGGEGDVADALANIVVTNHPAGSLLLIRPQTAAEVITVTDQAGGSGQVVLVDSVDFVMDQIDKGLLLLRVGTNWVEIQRFYGDNFSDFRAWIGLQKSAIITDPVAADKGKSVIVDQTGLDYSLAGPLVGLKNKLINGSFDWWQRGTSFTANGMTADRWRMIEGTGGAATISRQAFTLGQTAVPGEPSFYLEHDQTTLASTQPSAQQRIEGVRTFAGQTVNGSLWLKMDSTRDVDIQLLQNFGTGGAPSGSVTTNLVVAQSVTSSWVKYSFSVALPGIGSKTLGTNGDDYLSIRIQGPSGTTFTMDMALVQLESGAVATEFDWRPSWFELLLCHRYYWKTFPLETAPAQAAGATGALVFGSRTDDASRIYQEPMRHLPVPMRAAPTMTTYNPVNANAQAHNLTDAADHSATSGQSTRWGYTWTLTWSAGTTHSELHAIHLTAESEL